MTRDPRDFNERRDRIRREHRDFDRKFSVMFWVILVLSLATAVAWILVLVGIASRLWGVS